MYHRAMQLAPCSACRRHVRVDAACPFCGGQPTAPKTPIMSARARRAAVLFAGLLGVAGCGSEEDSTGIVPPYGLPARDTGVTDGTTSDSGPGDTTPADSTTTDTATGDSATADTATTDTATTDGPSDTPLDTKDTGGAVPPYGAPFDTGP
jgi:hypothetical protein